MPLLRSAKSSGRQRRSPTSPTNYIYNNARNDKSSPPARKNSDAPSHFWLRRFGLIILLLTVVASTVNVLTLSPNTKVSVINGSQSQAFLRDQSVYQQAASKVLAGSIWNGNKVTVNSAAVSQQLVKQFPEISSASLTLPLLAHRPTVYIQPAQPSLVLLASNGSFVIDNSGKALLTSDKLPSNAAKLPSVNDQSGLPVQLSKQVLTSEDVNFIRTVAGELAAKHITISSMDLPPSSRELDVHLANQSYYVKFNLESDSARQQAGTFLATQALLQRKHQTPSVYIDVRLNGRAYYK